MTTFGKIPFDLAVGANAGTAQLRFRAEVAGITTCKAGFTLVIEKIA